MVRSRTITAPTYLRGQVDREATTCAMFMKYSSQDTRASAMIDPDIRKDRNRKLGTIRCAAGATNLTASQDFGLTLDSAQPTLDLSYAAAFTGTACHAVCPGTSGGA